MHPCRTGARSILIVYDSISPARLPLFKIILVHFFTHEIARDQVI